MKYFIIFATVSMITEIVSFSFSTATIVKETDSFIPSPIPLYLWLKTHQDDELHWLAPTHKNTQPFGHLVLQDHVTNQNRDISATTVPMATKTGFMFSCSHCFYTILL